jgi:hypothetical protein
MRFGLVLLLLSPLLFLLIVLVKLLLHVLLLPLRILGAVAFRR